MAGEMAVVIRQFDGHPIRERSDDGYFDATELCRVHKKKWNDFVRLDMTEAFIGELELNTGLDRKMLVQATPGRGQGTWIHPLLAVNLAQWLSPRFAVWVSALVMKVVEHAATQPAIESPVTTALAQRVEQLERQLAAQKDDGRQWTISQRLDERRLTGDIKALGQKVARRAKDAIRRNANLFITFDNKDDGPDWVGEERGTSVYKTRHLRALDKAIDHVCGMFREHIPKTQAPSLFKPEDGVA